MNGWDENLEKNLGCLSLCLDPLFENAFSRMYSTENNAFGKILKLFIRSDYVKKNCICLVF